MRTLFTADLHIRIGQKNIPRAWALEQYKIMFAEINDIFEKEGCELEVHGGDIFDKIPTMEELSCYMGYLYSNPCRKRVIYDGNHEATKRGETFLKYLAPFIPKDTILINEYTQNVMGEFDVLPYKDLHKLKDIEPGSNILLTHVRGEIPPHVKPEVDLELFNQWELVFAGDLHAHTNSQRNIIYPGSPRTVSFHRNNVELGVVIIDGMHSKWVPITVPQLIRKTVNKAEDMIKTEFHHTIYELEGNMLELAKIDKDSELLDKKIVDQESPASLNLQNLTIEQELIKYLADIQNLPEREIDKIMEVYYDYS